MNTLWNTFLSGNFALNVDTGVVESDVTVLSGALVRKKLDEGFNSGRGGSKELGAMNHAPTTHQKLRFGDKAPPVMLTAPGTKGDSRTYTGWVGRGYKTTSDDRVKSAHRQGVLSQHTLTFILTSQLGKNLEFKITDQIDGTVRVSNRSIHSRKLAVESAPPGFTLTAIKNTQESGYASRDVVFPANLNHITEMTFRADTGPHKGMTITLLVALVEHTGGSRSFTHKDVVGVIIMGENEKIGHSWEAEFNFLKPAILNSDPKYHSTELKNGSRTLQMQWIYGKLPRFTKGTGSGYQVLNDPLERPDFALMKRPCGDVIPLERQKDGSLRLRDGYREIKKSVNPPDIYHFGSHTLIANGEPPLILYELPNGKILCIEIDIPTFYDFTINAKKTGWHGGFISWGGGVVRAKNEAFRGTAADMTWHQDEGLATLSWLDEKHDQRITLTDVIVTISAATGKPRFDFEHTRSVITDAAGHVQDVALKFQGGCSIAVAGQTLHTVKSVDALEGAWLVEMDSIDFIDTNMADETQDGEEWTRFTVGDPSELKITERVIAGQPFHHYALPLFVAPNAEHKTDVNHAARIREALAEPKEGKSNLYIFTGPDVRPGTLRWQIRLEMAVQGGQLRPVARVNKSSGSLEVQIREIHYHDGSTNHEAKKLNGTWVTTDSNPLGWAIQIIFAGRLIYIQPYAADLDPKRLAEKEAAALEKTTDVFGLMITSDLMSPTTLAATRAFQGVMPQRGAYGDWHPAAPTSGVETPSTAPTVGAPHIVIPAPIEIKPIIPPLFLTPGLEAKTNPNSARETFIKLHLARGIDYPLTLSAGDISAGGISFEVSIRTKIDTGITLLKTGKVTLHTPQGDEEATIQVFDAKSGCYHLVDGAGNRYLLYLTHNDVHLSTTPLAPETNIDQDLMQKWAGQSRQKNRATSDWLGLKGKQLQLSRHVPGSYPLHADPGAEAPEDIIIHYDDGSQIRIELVMLAGKQVPRRISYKGAHDEGFVSGTKNTLLQSSAQRVGEGISLMMIGVNTRAPNGMPRVALFYNILFAVRKGIVMPLEPESPYRDKGTSVKVQKLREHFMALERKPQIWVRDPA